MAPETKPCAGCGQLVRTDAKACAFCKTPTTAALLGAWEAAQAARCDAVDFNGDRCSLMRGHDGQHAVHRGPPAAPQAPAADPSVPGLTATPAVPAAKGSSPWGGLLVLIVIGAGLFWYFSGSGSPSSTGSTPARATPAAVATPKLAPGLTVAQQNAIESAQSYLDYSAFSRKGLIEQLEYEGFSTADATFAVDTLNADWNQQAARSAKSYLDYSSFSRQSLIEQLEYEGYTRAQAVYGVDQAGL